MLEIVCVASLALSTNVNTYPKLINSTPIKTLEIYQAAPYNLISQNIYLAKGKPYKSRYRQEADRYQEDHERDYEEINGAEVRDGRIYRDADNYRRESDDRDERVRDGRSYRDTDYYRQESEQNRDSRSYQQERYRDRDNRWNSY